MYFTMKVMLLFWKYESPPTFKLFLDQIPEFSALEKLTLEKHNSRYIIQDLWFLLFSYFENFSRGDQ